MFRPTMKQRHLDAIVRMAAESGRDPQDVYAELLDQATSNEPPPNARQATAPPTPSPATPNAGAPQAPRPDGSRVAKVVVVPPPEGPPMGETIAQAKRRESGEPEVKEPDDEDPSGTAPAEKMTGAKPNPLSLIKQWAGAKGDDDAKPSFLKKSDAEPQNDDERKAALRSKYLGRGRVQQRG